MMRGQWWFTLALTILLGASGAWLNNLGSLPETPTQAYREYEITQIRGDQFDTQGNLAYRISARAARNRSGDDSVRFDRPVLEGFDKNQYHVSAIDGLLNTRTHLFRFENQVLVNENHGTNTLKTNHLTLDMDSGRVFTDAPVDYWLNGASGSAIGLDYNRHDGLLSLNSRIKAIIHDTSKY